MIECQAVTKQYGVQTVLRGINLHIAQGEFVSIVGANGAGKSTLLRILATLIRPTTGSVKIGGWSLPAEADRVRRHLGLVSHHSLLYPELTSAENLHFYARLYHLPNPDQAVKTALQGVGLWSRQRDLVRTFSRGMLQRLTIARATLHQPDVLLLDEPYTGLDQEAIALLDQLLKREHEIGRTILLITHDLARGFELCNRLLILQKGRITHEINRSETTFADFLATYHRGEQ